MPIEMGSRFPVERRGWVPMKETVPPIGVTVLVWDQTESAPRLMSYFNPYWKNETGDFILGNTNRYSQWCVLPAFPAQ